MGQHGAIISPDIAGSPPASSPVVAKRCADHPRARYGAMTAGRDAAFEARATSSFDYGAGSA